MLPSPHCILALSVDTYVNDQVFMPSMLSLGDGVSGQSQFRIKRDPKNACLIHIDSGLAYKWRIDSNSANPQDNSTTRTKASSSDRKERKSTPAPSKDTEHTRFQTAIKARLDKLVEEVNGRNPEMASARLGELNDDLRQLALFSKTNLRFEIMVEGLAGANEKIVDQSVRLRWDPNLSKVVIESLELGLERIRALDKDRKLKSDAWALISEARSLLDEPVSIAARGLGELLARMEVTRQAAMAAGREIAANSPFTLTFNRINERISKIGPKTMPDMDVAETKKTPSAVEHDALRSRDTTQGRVRQVEGKGDHQQQSRVTESDFHANIQPDQDTLRGSIQKPIDVAPSDLVTILEIDDHDGCEWLDENKALTIEVGQPKQRFLFRYIPPGTVEIGLTPEQQQHLAVARGNPMHGFSARNQFEVAIDEGFFLLESEVTSEQFQSLMNSNRLRADKSGRPQATSWDEAMEFCRAMSEEIGFDVRLPTEVEWEYAARGPDGNLFPDGRESLKDDQTRERTDMTSTSDESWCRLRDMTGNLSEWCLDRYESSKLAPPTNVHDYRPSQIDTSSYLGESSIKVRAIRGGSSVDATEQAAAPLRRLGLQQKKSEQVGFRPALILKAHSP